MVSWLQHVCSRKEHHLHNNRGIIPTLKQIIGRQGHQNPRASYHHKSQGSSLSYPPNTPNFQKFQPEKHIEFQTAVLDHPFRFTLHKTNILFQMDGWNTTSFPFGALGLFAGGFISSF